MAFDNYCLQDLEKALDSMFGNASVGPFICRQLIQRLVTSNPSPGYLERVVRKFNDDGTAQHVRGNMQAVIRAILLDGEARNTALPAALANASGKQREPLLRISGPRGFPDRRKYRQLSQSGGTTMTITTAAPHLLAEGNGVFLDFTGIPIPPTTPPLKHMRCSTIRRRPPSPLLSMPPAFNVTYTQPANSNTVTVNTGGPQVVGARSISTSFLAVRRMDFTR